jgi:MoaA/NifB/PqqE/SkfB family radical SAM enzyme
VIGKSFCVQGIDHFSRAENEGFWKKKASGKISLQIIGLSTTSACNYKCNYCYGTAYKREGKKLSLEEQKSILDQAKEIGATSAVICGDGEPTVDKDLVGIIRHCKELGMFSAVVSNGNIFGNNELSQKIYGMNSDELVNEFYENDASLVLKMDSMVPEVYENIVGVKGSHANFKKGLDMIFEKGFNKTYKNSDGFPVTRIAFTAVASKQNFLELAKMRRYANENNCQFICKLPSFVGSAVDNKNLFFSPSEETTIWLRENYLPTISEKPETVTTDELHCGVWHYGAVVGETGDIRLCYTAPCPPKMRVGNVREKSLKELLKIRAKVFGNKLNRGESCHIKRKMYQAKAS